SGPPFSGVGRRASPRTLPFGSATTVWILVPPRSMPPSRARLGVTAFLFAAAFFFAGAFFFWEAAAMSESASWRIWWQKHRWYERNKHLRRRWRLNRHAARGGFFIRYPVEGEVLEGLDSGRLRIGDSTRLESGCCITMAPGAEISIGDGCFLNRETMLAAQERIEI